MVLTWQRLWRIIVGMVRRTGPVHVASIKATRKGKTYVTHLLRRTYREDGKVKHQTLGNLSHLPPLVIELIKGSLLGQIYVPISEAVKVVRSLPHGHVAAVLGTARKLGMPQLLAVTPERCGHGYDSQSGAVPVVQAGDLPGASGGDPAYHAGGGPQAGRDRRAGAIPGHGLAGGASKVD